MHDDNDDNSIFRVNMLMKFYSFELTEYSKVCYIDGDSLFLKNCDFIFSYRAPAAKHLGWEYLPIQDTPPEKIGIFDCWEKIRPYHREIHKKQYTSHSLAFYL